MSDLFSWTTLVIAAVALVLVFVSFRVFRKITLTFRFRGAVSVSPWEQQPCPHLGLLDEPFIHRDDPTEDHRCYLWMQRDRIDLTHQKGFCLSSAHLQCPWLGITPPNATEPARRRLVGRLIAAPVYVLSGTWNVLLSLLIWLIPSSRRTIFVVRQRLDTVITVLSAFAAMVSSEASPRFGSTAKTIGHALKVAARACYAWSSSTAIMAARKVSSSRNRPVATVDRPAAGESAAIAKPTTAVDEPVRAKNTEPLAPVAPAGGPIPPSPTPIPGMRPLATGAVSHLTSLLEQGKVAGMSGNRDVAYSLFCLAVDLDQMNDEAWLWKGAMATTPKEKHVCLQRALAINPNNQRAQQLLRQMDDATTAESATAPDSVGDVKASQRAEARPVDAGVVEPMPAPRVADGGALGSEEGFINAGLAALESGNEDEANRLLVRATEAYPRSEKAWFWRAKTSATLDEVIHSLRQALILNPANEMVKANLEWAIQRQQKEDATREEASRAVAEKAKAVARAKPRRNPIAVGFRWLSATICLALAVYWVSVAVQPLLDVPALKGASDGIQETTQINLQTARPLFESMALWLPRLTWMSLPENQRFDFGSGYSLLAAIPYTIGFLYLFVAIGVFRRETWSRFWCFAITTVSLGLAAVLFTNSQATALITSLGLATVLMLLVSRSEFRGQDSVAVFRAGGRERECR